MACRRTRVARRTPHLRDGRGRSRLDATELAVVRITVIPVAGAVLGEPEVGE